jgi:hypothetical protein
MTASLPNHGSPYSAGEGARERDPIGVPPYWALSDAEHQEAEEYALLTFSMNFIGDRNAEV